MLMPCSQSEVHQQELLTLEDNLRKKELIHKPEVQQLLICANKTFNERAYQIAIEQLRLILETHNTNAMRQPDEFRPYCPESLNYGSLYLLNQMDDLPIKIDYNKFVTSLGVFGPQGSGKSFEIIDLCSKIRQISPSTKITIIDPKGGFSNLKEFLHIDLLQASFDLLPPSNVSLEIFVHELMPILAQTIGLIYGLELLNQAAFISLHQRQQYIGNTGIDPNICLKDIHEALNLIKVSSFRKTGYKDAATTALSLILGKLKLFECRKGISLNWLFSQNTILNARCLTDDMQCRFFAVYLLYWLYQQARYKHETNKIKHVLVVDDASRFIGTIGSQFDGHSKTSSLGHILAVLRSSGICLIYATQLPAQVDPAVLSLTRNALVIGNINGQANLQVIQNIASLINEQKGAITRFKPRETLAYISGSSWSYPIHGWTPDINISDYITNYPLKPSIEIKPWHSLTDIPKNKTVETENIEGNEKSSDIKISVNRLVLDCVHYPFAKAREHAERMDSFREYDAAKTEAVQNGLLIASQCGKSLYLIPTQRAYNRFSIANPYQRATSIEHAFYVQLAANILKKHPDLTVQIETPIGNKGATIDLTATDKSGNMVAYEITISTSNLSSNASRLQDTAYRKIIWLCRDAATTKAVKAYFNKTTALPSELTAKFQYIHFSKWIPQMEKKHGK